MTVVTTYNPGFKPKIFSDRVIGSIKQKPESLNMFSLHGKAENAGFVQPSSVHIFPVKLMI